MNAEAAWKGAIAVERLVGEVRFNMLRIVALVAFYGNHFFSYYVRHEDLGVTYNLAVTGIVLAWFAQTLALQVALSRRWNPPSLAYAATAFDAFLITLLLLLADGPKSVLTLLYLLLIAGSSLRQSKRLVWAATLMALLGYLALLGDAKWNVRHQAWRIPRRQQAIFAIGLGCAGLFAGQAVRQAHRLAEDYGSRVGPTEGDA